MHPPDVTRPSDPDQPRSGGSGAKLSLRDHLLTGRRRRSPAQLGEADRAIAQHLLAAPEVRAAATATAYVSVGGEPGTGHLLAGLHAAGTRVLLPVLLPDGDLDWAVYTGDADLRPASFGLLEPTGPRLGPEAITGADAVLVPGLAVSPAGVRLGRGRGCYDRALARVAAATFTCVLLFDEEVGLDVPAEPHDRSVRAAATPGGLVALG